MPAPEQNFLVAPLVSSPVIRLEPAHNAVHSLLLVAKSDEISGLGEWVGRTRASLNAETYQRHRLVTVGFYFAVQPTQSWPSFPTYLDHLESLPANRLRDKLLDAYARIPPIDESGCHELGDEPLPVDLDVVLASPQNYLAFLKERFSPEHVDEAVETEAYHYLAEPPALKELIVSHLRYMWENYLSPEWEQIRPMLRDAVDAFGEVDFSDMGRLEIAQYITGQALEETYWRERLEQAEQVIFVPSAHVGPYLWSFKAGDALGIIFGARLPRGAHFDAPDLSRAEIVVRLNALADDTRLRILKLIAEEGELRSQSIIEELDLSQSAASRHLKQLSATGYLSERRCAGAKCYRLNPERVEDTLRAVAAFLIG